MAAINAKLIPLFIMTVSLIKRYLYFFIVLYFLPECFYFGKLSYSVDFLDIVGGWFVTSLFNT